VVGIRVTWDDSGIVCTGMMWHAENEHEAQEVLEWIQNLTKLTDRSARNAAKHTRPVIRTSHTS
jgi:hypothetical protein